MKIELVSGLTIYEAAKNVFLSINKRDVDTEYFIVVPDRFTLQAEKLLFDTLNITASFNINIISLTSLANKVLEDEHISTISALEGVTKVYIGAKKAQEQLLFYKKITPEFCHEVYKNILQLKSCCLRPTDLKPNTKLNSLNNKIHDLKIIYEAYLEEMQDRVDSSDLIEKCSQNLTKASFLKDSVLLFAGFDSFTESNYRLIKSALSVVKKVVIGYAEPAENNNSYIYDSDIFDKVKNLCLESKAEFIKTTFPTNLGENQKILAENLFANGKTCKEDYLSVFACPSREDEVNFIANLIKYSIYNGQRYKDFSIAVPNLESYKNIIERVFTSRKIPVYLDTSQKIENSLLVKFIFKLFDIKRKNYLNSDLIYIVSSPLVSLKNRETVIAYINENQIAGKDKFKKHLQKDLAWLNKTMQKLEKCSALTDFSSFIKGVLEDVKPKFLEYLISLEQEGLLKEKSLEEQTYDEILNILEVIERQDAGGFQEFYRLFKLATGLKEISALPSFIDAVFVGDATSSYFGSVKNFVLLGANRGELPLPLADTGILSDGDILKLNLKSRIEPTVKMINRRNRFRLFCNLTLAKNRLIISYLSNVDSRPSDKSMFVKFLLNGQKEIRLEDYFSFNDDDFEKFLLSIGGQEGYAKHKLIEYSLSGGISRKFLGSLQAATMLNTEKYVLTRDTLKIKDPNKFFFNGKFSVSQMERFFECPFRHFVDYGLRLKEKKNKDIQKNQLGSVYHKLLEILFKNYKNKVKNLTDKEVEAFVLEHLNEALEAENIVLDEGGAVELKSIKKDAIKILKRAVKEVSFSNFVPIFEEYNINESLNLNNLPVNLKAKVDRIDKLGDNGIRIIDYKTGHINSSIFTEVYYGKKLQLLVYGRAVKKALNKDLLGLYYFNAKPDYENADTNILFGLTVGDGIKNVDTRLADDSFKSDIIAVKKGKNGLEFNQISKDELTKLEDYSFKIITNAREEILQGKIAPLPNEDACSYCKFKAFCLKSSEGGVRKYYSKNKDVFLKEGQDEGI